MFKKNIEPDIPVSIKNSIIPRYSKEQKIIRKALAQLEALGSPRFDVSKNRFVRKLDIKDETALYYVMGLLESLMMEGEEDAES